MKITIVYDNTTTRPDLTPDWGFACYIETAQRNILFDTGANGAILLDNMHKLRIEPRTVDDVFISHAHFDHVGGLSAFLNENNRVHVYVPTSLRGVRNAQKVIHIEESQALYEGIYTTGELEGIEQSMVVEQADGLVLITGCSHPSMKNIFDAAARFGKVRAIIGGLHGFSDFELFTDLNLICATHCTRHKTAIQQRYPDVYVEGGVGKVIEL
jgi:7,8-dihydropterin-6-yl-methyl-4-(beta-D-ribofuranosyl)aminobenzene 5'-phosphate synthase